MLNKIYNFIKRIIMSFFMLYGYNLLVPASAIIPINLITVIIITVFSLPALLVLIVLKLLIY